MDNIGSIGKKGSRATKKEISRSEKINTKEDEDALALQKEKASILNRIKKKLHIKKDESNDETTSPKAERRTAKHHTPHSPHQQPADLSLSPATRKKQALFSSTSPDDDMQLYDDSDDDTSRYVPSIPENKYKLQRSGSNKQSTVDNTEESAEYLKGLKTLQKRDEKRDEEMEEDEVLMEKDEVLMEKGEEEELLEELESWGKLTQGEEEQRREADKRRELNNNGPARKVRSPIPSQSLDEATVSAILNEKLTNLDFKKQKYLLKVLEKLEKGDVDASIDPRLSASLDQLLKKANEKPAPPLVRPAISKEITLRILSNWGDKSYVGLTEVEVFDHMGQQINLGAGAIQTGYSSGKADESLSRLVDGQSKTINDRHMWLTDISHMPLDLTIYIPESNMVSKLKLWNYNKTVKDAAKGVQECEVWISGNRWWHGVVDKGCGNQLFDYATIIPLLSYQPPEHKPAKTRPQQKSITTSSPNKAPSFLTVDGGGAKLGGLPRSNSSEKGGVSGLPRSSSNDGKSKVSVHDQATRIGMSKSLSPRGDDEPLSDKNQPKPIWLSSGVEDSTLKRQPDLSLDLPAPANGNARSLDSDDSPLSTRKARPHSRHSRDQLEKEKEKERVDKEKAKESELSIFGASKMAKSPSFGNSSIFSSPSSSQPVVPNPNPTPRRGRLADSSAASLAPNPASNSANNSNVLYSNLTANSPATDKAQKKRVTALDIGESSTDYIPSFRGGEDTARRKRDNAYIPSSSTTTTSSSSTSSASSKDKQAISANNFSIEQSWENLNLFNVKQLGRIKETKDNSSSSIPSSTTVVSPNLPSISVMSPSLTTPTPRSLQTSTTPRMSSYPSSTTSVASSSSSRPAAASSASDFAIPFLPHGQILDITLISTWGDPYYVGLSGIDFFDSNGKFITFPDPHKQITANPADINELPGYGQDPRTIDKLVDGHQRSCDDLHVWLAPFTPGHKNEIKIVFHTFVSLSLIRIWNYNKSRIHSYRGAKEVEIRLDNSLIFRGQIKRAPGLLHQSDEAAEYILFTQDESILASIEQNDPVPLLPSRGDLEGESNHYIGPRPKTGDKRKEAEIDDEYLLQLQSNRADGRPTTAAIVTPRKDLLSTNISTTSNNSTHHPLSGSGGKSVPADTASYPTGKQLTFKFLSTWGDRHYMGLTGIIVYDQRGKPITIPSKQLWAHPRDINDMPGAPGDDDRTLDKLVDGTNTTTSDHHMWLIPFATSPPPLLRIDLGSSTTVSAIRIWNYNKNVEDSFRGAKQVSLSLDDVPISADPFVFRKASGIADFDFGQYISFANYDKRSTDTEFGSRWDKARNCKPAASILTKLDYQMFPLPCGHILKFSFLSTWGDPHYLGLNGIEVYDWTGHMLPISAKNALAIPSSVAVVPDMRNDARTMPNLFNGINDTFDDRHMWLTPFTGANVLYVVINDATAISMIKMWNYAKTPMRGVEEFELYVDDLLVYKGVLKMAPNPSSGPPPKFGQTILFSYDEKLVAKEKDAVYSSQSEQHVQFINDNQVVIPVKKQNPSAPPQPRPSTSVGSRRESLA